MAKDKTIIVVVIVVCLILSSIIGSLIWVFRDKLFGTEEEEEEEKETPSPGPVRPPPSGTPSPGPVRPPPSGTPASGPVRPPPSGTPSPGPVRPPPSGTPAPGPVRPPPSGTPSGTPNSGPIQISIRSIVVSVSVSGSTVSFISDISQPIKFRMRGVYPTSSFQDFDMTFDVQNTNTGINNISVTPPQLPWDSYNSKTIQFFDRNDVPISSLEQF